MKHARARVEASPPVVPDELWELVEPLLPRAQKRMGRRRLPDRPALEGILYVLRTGIPWQRLPTELGFGSGFTCWRRLGEWQRAGVWERLVELLQQELPAVGQLEWSRAELPGPAQTKSGRRARARLTPAASSPVGRSS